MRFFIHETNDLIMRLRCTEASNEPYSEVRAEIELSPFGVERTHQRLAESIDETPQTSTGASSPLHPGLRCLESVTP